MNLLQPRSLLVLGGICFALALSANTMAFAKPGSAPKPSPAKSSPPPTSTGGSTTQKVPPHSNQGPLNLPPY